MNRKDHPARYAEMYKRGTPVGEIAASFGVQRPAVWRGLRSAGVLPPYNPRKPGGAGRPKGGGQPGYTLRRLEAERERVAAKQADYASIMATAVDRDPCPRCGVRRDLGCPHTASRLAL